MLGIFLGFLFLKIVSFLNHILKVQKLELNNLNYIEFNHTLMTLFPQSIFLYRVDCSNFLMSFCVAILRPVLAL